MPAINDGEVTKAHFTEIVIEILFTLQTKKRQPLNGAEIEKLVRALIDREISRGERDHGHYREAGSVWGEITQAMNEMNNLRNRKRYNHMWTYNYYNIREKVANYENIGEDCDKRTGK